MLQIIIGMGFLVIGAGNMFYGSLSVLRELSRCQDSHTCTEEKAKAQSPDAAAPLPAVGQSGIVSPEWAQRPPCGKNNIKFEEPKK